jgi:hypothetical protein
MVVRNAVLTTLLKKNLKSKYYRRGKKKLYIFMKKQKNNCNFATAVTVTVVTKLINYEVL